MTIRSLVARDLGVALAVISLALTGACKTGADGQAEAAGQLELSAGTKRSVTANKAAGADSAGARVEARSPGQAQLDVAAAGAHAEAKASPGNPSLKVGKAGALLDANVQAGKPSLNIGGLRAAASGSSTPPSASKSSAKAGAKGKISFGIGQ